MSERKGGMNFWPVHPLMSTGSQLSTMIKISDKYIDIPVIFESLYTTSINSLLFEHVQKYYSFSSILSYHEEGEGL